MPKSVRRPSALIMGPVILASVLGIAQPSHAQSGTQDRPAGQQQTGQPQGQQAPTGNAAQPAVEVATVKQSGGRRVGKMIGTAVFNDQNPAERIGVIDDIITDPQNPDALKTVVVQVGGFLGVGGKLIAVAWGNLRWDNQGHGVLPSATKEQISNMPRFVYADQE